MSNILKLILWPIFWGLVISSLTGILVIRYSSCGFLDIGPCGFAGGWPVPFIENYPSKDPNEHKWVYGVTSTNAAKILYMPSFNIGLSFLNTTNIILLLINTIFYAIILGSVSSIYNHFHRKVNSA